MTANINIYYSVIISHMMCHLAASSLWHLLLSIRFNPRKLRLCLIFFLSKMLDSSRYFKHVQTYRELVASWSLIVFGFCPKRNWRYHPNLADNFSLKPFCLSDPSKPVYLFVAIDARLGLLLCCCLVTLQVSQQMVYQPQDDNDDTWISHGDIEGLGFFCQSGSESQWDGRKKPRDGVVFGGKYLPKIWESHRIPVFPFQDTTPNGKKCRATCQPERFPDDQRMPGGSFFFSGFQEWKFFQKSSKNDLKWDIFEEFRGFGFFLQIHAEC